MTTRQEPRPLMDVLNEHVATVRARRALTGLICMCPDRDEHLPWCPVRDVGGHRCTTHVDDDPAPEWRCTRTHGHAGPHSLPTGWEWTA